MKQNSGNARRERVCAQPNGLVPGKTRLTRKIGDFDGLKVYIAGKVIGLPPQEVSAKFARAEAELKALGYSVVNPITVVHERYSQAELQRTTWHEIMRMLIGELVQCDVVYMLPCWVHSPGAHLERFVAGRLQIQIAEAL